MKTFFSLLLLGFATPAFAQAPAPGSLSEAELIRSPDARPGKRPRDSFRRHLDGAGLRGTGGVRGRPHGGSWRFRLRLRLAWR